MTTLPFLRLALAASAGLFLISASLDAQGTFQNFGAGCRGSHGTPLLTAKGRHEIGSPTVFHVAPLPGSGAGWLFLGSSDSKWGTIPLPLTLGGTAGCKLYVSPDIATLFAPSNASGIFEAPLLVPDDLQFVNVPLYLQHFAHDPAVTTPVKLIASNAGKWLIACGNGPKKKTGTIPVQVQLPGISAVGYPGMSVSGNHYSGNIWWQCCGRYSRVRACTYEGSGTMGGTANTFTCPVSSFLSKVNNRIYSDLKKVSGGTIKCSTTLGLKFDRVGFHTHFTCAQYGCTKTHKWTGKGDFKFGKGCAGEGRVSASLKIGFIKKSFSFPLELTGAPSGGWLIEPSPYHKGRYRLRQWMSNAHVRVSGSVKIPIINKTISIGFNVATPELSGSSAVTMPIPTVCR